MPLEVIAKQVQTAAMRRLVASPLVVQATGMAEVTKRSTASAALEAPTAVGAEVVVLEAAQAEGVAQGLALPRVARRAIAPNPARQQLA